MDIKGTLQTQRNHELMLYNAAYYKYIFKKTEKIVCAIFYILKDSEKGQKGIVTDSLKNIAKKTLDEVTETLSCSMHDGQGKIRRLAISYVALQSNIRLAHADTLIDSAVTDTLCLEIDVLLKALRNHLIVEDRNPLDLSVEEVPTKTSLEAYSYLSTKAQPVSFSPTRPVRTPVPQHESNGQTTPRRQAIKDILRTQPNATIKDISAKITDCSEKTLQRELISMIKDGMVSKEGERRWSRYSLI